MSVGLLPFFTGGPAGKEQGRIGMGGALENRCRVYGSGALRKEIVDRSALLDPGRIVMRIAGEAGRRLARDEKLGKLLVAFVKLRIVRGDLSQQRDRLLIAFVFLR